MNIKFLIKSIINKSLSKLGYEIRRTDSKVNFPIELSHEEIKIIESIENYTMTGRLRIFSLISIFKEIINKNVKGDLVECGVWRGGNLILLQKLNELYKQNKTIYGFDTFDGMTPAGQFDIDLRNVDSQNLLRFTKKINDKKNIWAFCDIETVKKNILDNVSSNNIKLIKGDVKSTLKSDHNLPNEISILRLDTDFYESTKIELETLYPRLSKGGILIIDDYGHFKGCRKAVDEYFDNSKITLHYIDYSCRYLRKD